MNFNNLEIYKKYKAKEALIKALIADNKENKKQKSEYKIYLNSNEPRPKDLIIINDIRKEPFLVIGKPIIHKFGANACWRLPTTEGDISYDGDASIIKIEESDSM